MEAPLTFRALHPTFGAECSGVDFSQPVPEQTIGEIRAAMARYGVLVFRRTRLDDAGHVAFARQFGQLDTSTVITMPWAKHRLAPHKELTDVGNIDNKGRVMPKSSLAFQGGRANGLFHVDCSFHARRAGYSILRAHQLPPKGTGGGTMFADTRTAYDDLEDAIKKDISGYILCHSSMHSKKIAAPDYIPFGIIKADEFSMIRRKLVQLHEPSGRINLYMAAHAHHIDGWTEKESQPVIQRLLQHASQDQYTFTIDWEDAGDLVIWDNTCVMHRGCGGSFQGRHIRDMRRATVYDDSSSAWGLDGDSGIPSMSSSRIFLRTVRQLYRALSIGLAMAFTKPLEKGGSS